MTEQTSSELEQEADQSALFDARHRCTTWLEQIDTHTVSDCRSEMIRANNRLCEGDLSHVERHIENVIEMLNAYRDAVLNDIGDTKYALFQMRQEVFDYRKKYLELGEG